MPTKSGIIFSILLLLLLIGSVGNIALLATWKNLAGLRLSAGSCTPVFAGEEARFSIQLNNTDQKTKYAVNVSHDGEIHDTADITSDKVSYLHFNVKTHRRGYCNPKQFRLFTEFPMGLFISWTVIDLSMACLVYPKPASRIDPDLTNTIKEGSQSLNSRGLEEFSGLKKYQSGDSWRHISWKALARNNELFTKEFTGGQPQLIWINWGDITASNNEERLSIMSRLIIDAHFNDYLYGLKLENTVIAPNVGNSHYHRCMKHLALHGL